MIKGTVTSQGRYADGRDICELYVKREGANMMPYEYGHKKPINLIIGKTCYEAGCHETEKGVVWISSVLHKIEPRREKIRLVDALEEINLGTGDRVTINKINEKTFSLEAFC
jgi:hypothetical protein